MGSPDSWSCLLKESRLYDDRTPRQNLSDKMFPNLMLIKIIMQYRGCTTVSIGIDLVLPPHHMFLKAELTRIKLEIEGKHGRLTRT